MRIHKHLCLAFLFCLSFIGTTLLGQSLSQFNGLKSTGELPEQVTRSSSDQYKVIRSTVEVKKSKKRKGKPKEKKKLVNKFKLESTFAIDEMMRTGLILFNDETSTYVRNVAKKLLVNQPELLSKLNFYVVRSPQVNAFATGRGDIFINVGLLTYLETEAQLAFVLAHELMHWEHDHSMNVFLEYEGIDNKEKQYKGKKNFNALLKKSNYSKRIETEADSKGLELFLTSPYGTSSLDYIFDVLAKAHATYTNEPFDKDYLSIAGFSFKDSLLLSAVDSIVAFEGSDRMSTHPGVKSRREKLAATLEKEGKSIDQDFLIGKERFEQIKTLSKFEVNKILVERMGFMEAIYYNSILQKQYPDNPFLENIKLKALYGLAKLKKLENGDKIQGEVQQVYHLFNQLELLDRKAIAIAHLWEAYKSTNDNTMKLRLEDLITDINEEGDMKKLNGENTKNAALTSGIFKEYLSDNQFTALLETKSEAPKTISKNELKKGYRLGIKKVHFVYPYYLKFNIRDKKSPIKFIETEIKQTELVTAINENAEKLKISANILDVHGLSSNATAAQFLEIVTLEDWASYRLSSIEGYIPPNHEEAVEIFEREEINHLALTGGFSLLGLPNTDLSAKLSPYIIVKPKSASLYYSIVIDVNTRKVLMRSYNTSKQMDKKGIINANIYWLLLQMKTTPKKKQK